MLKIGHLVPATVIKALPGHDAYLMAIAETGYLALLPRANAGSHLRVGDNTVACVHSCDKATHGWERKVPFENNVYKLSQSSSIFYRRLTEMFISPLLMEGKVEVIAAASVPGSGFAKVAVVSMDGSDPVAACLPYIEKKAVNAYTESTITLIRYSHNKEKYIVDSFSPAPKEGILEVIPYQDLNEADVFVRPDKVGLYVGKRGANVATVSKLTGVHVRVHPAKHF
ncbi:MAG: hypothetical protein WCJ37_05690 [Syntrophus sp. (in: bacteria)]